jgi:hypothetical protein
MVTFFVGGFFKGKIRIIKKSSKKFVFFLYIVGYFFVDSFFKGKIRIMKKPSQNLYPFYIL